MSLSGAQIRLLAAKGFSIEEIANFDEVGSVDAAAEKRRAWDRQRAAKRRAEAKGLVDNPADSPVDKVPPRLPLRDNQTPSTPPPISVEAQARAWFDEVFWPAWPHKVGKDAAIKATITLWRKRKGDMAAVMAGLESYLASKPADRNWMNPATFLNGKRFEDAPAPVVEQRPRDGPRRQREQFSDLLRESLANEPAYDPGRRPQHETLSDERGYAPGTQWPPDADASRGRGDILDLRSEPADVWATPRLVHSS